jgi:hypothetical protein
MSFLTNAINKVRKPLRIKELTFEQKLKIDHFCGLICMTGDCTKPKEKGYGDYCQECSDHVDALNNNESTVIRERAFTKHNVKEWIRHMEDYPDLWKHLVDNYPRVSKTP